MNYNMLVKSFFDDIVFMIDWYFIIVETLTNFAKLLFLCLTKVIGSIPHKLRMNYMVILKPDLLFPQNLELKYLS